MGCVGMIEEEMFTQWRLGRKKSPRAPGEGLVLSRKRSTLFLEHEERKEGNAHNISKYEHGYQLTDDL